MKLAWATVWANLIIAACGIALGWALLRMMDIGSGRNFKDDVLPEIIKGNMAVAVYYGARILAVYGIIGVCISRVPY